jgi:hypothetical protein
VVFLFEFKEFLFRYQISVLIAFHILIIVCLWLIKFLNYIVINLFNPPSSCCLESIYYFHVACLVFFSVRKSISLSKKY